MIRNLCFKLEFAFPRLPFPFFGLQSPYHTLSSSPFFGLQSPYHTLSSSPFFGLQSPYHTLSSSPFFGLQSPYHTLSSSPFFGLQSPYHTLAHSLPLPFFVFPSPFSLPLAPSSMPVCSPLLPHKPGQCINQCTLPVDGNLVSGIIFLFVVPSSCRMSTTDDITGPWVHFIVGT